MSVNFGANDVVLAVKFARGIYRSCQNARADYNALAVDIDSLAKHLEKIQSSIPQSESLVADNREELEELINRGKAILGDIQKAINKYKPLEKKRALAPKARISWELDQGDINKTKQRLKDHVSLL